MEKGESRGSRNRQLDDNLFPFIGSSHSFQPRERRVFIDLTVRNFKIVYYSSTDEFLIYLGADENNEESKALVL